MSRKELKVKIKYTKGLFVGWLRFLILVLSALALQVGVSRVFGLGPQRIVPDLLLLWAMLWAFHGSKDQVLVGCWVLGLVKDLSSEACLGSYALGFGFLGLVVVQLRGFLSGERLLIQVVVTFLGSLLVEHFVLFVCVLKGELPQIEYRGLMTAILVSALITAALYPYGYGLVWKLHRHLGFGQPRSARR